jgi:hypothetical protein
LNDYKGEVLSRLNLTFDHSIARMSGFTGGQNDGIFFIQSVSFKLYCLKVVRGGRKFDSVPSERENYLAIKKKFPDIVGDENVCFPRCIMSFSRQVGGVDGWDVFVMNVARGERMAEVVGRLVKSNDLNKLGQVCLQVGIQVVKFHQRYFSTQHCDLQCSNIYIDTSQQPCVVTLIDLGGMGSNVQGNDVDYFQQSIRLLGRTYGSEFEKIAIENFSKGYYGRPIIQM